MKNLRPLLQLFLSSVPLMTLRSHAAVPPATIPPAPEPDDPVKLRPLNMPGENLFAGHRSHSSHSSHRSSSGGGGYATPQPSRQAVPEPRPAPAPAPYVPAPYTPSTPQNFVPAPPNQPVDPGRAANVSPKPGAAATPGAAPTLTLAEKRRLQIMRVQIALTSLGIYDGRIHGTLDAETKEALKRFQLVKGQSQTGLMTTETLNALGVPAVQ